jgi:hypothetical protein
LGSQSGGPSLHSGSAACGRQRPHKQTDTPTPTLLLLNRHGASLSPHTPRAHRVPHRGCALGNRAMTARASVGRLARDGVRSDRRPDGRSCLRPPGQKRRRRHPAELPADRDGRRGPAEEVTLRCSWPLRYRLVPLERSRTASVAFRREDDRPPENRHCAATAARCRFVIPT